MQETLWQAGGAADPAAIERLAFSVPEAAEAIGVSVRFLWRAVYAGDIAVVRLGRRRLIRREDLAEFLKRHVQPETTTDERAEGIVASLIGARPA